VMDMSFTPHQLTTPVQADQMPRWSPDGSQLAFARVEGGVSQIYRMNADGSGITKLSTSMQSDTWPTWSPNF
jgi:TolB protein